MAVTPRNQPRVLPVVGTAIAIVLIGILANRAMGTSGEAKPQLVASPATVGAAAEKSAARPKERVRYQATIENWRRYRDLTKSD
jgi:hypothetical protein